jgi:alpha-tubulin suppressor-like RCC1 family protein
MSSARTRLPATRSLVAILVAPAAVASSSPAAAEGLSARRAARAAAIPIAIGADRRGGSPGVEAGSAAKPQPPPLQPKAPTLKPEPPTLKPEAPPPSEPEAPPPSEPEAPASEPEAPPPSEPEAAASSSLLTVGNTTVGWGTNLAGELGPGFRSPPFTTPVAGRLHGVRQAAAAYESGYAVLGDGSLWAWGGNYAGQLGDGTVAQKVNPVQLPGISHVAQVAVAGAHAMALLDSGTVLAWGGNFWGTLGNGTRDDVEGAPHPVPAPVPGLHGVVEIASGGGDNAALLANGTVVAWGENQHGQLGDGTKEMKLRPTPVKGLTGVRMLALGGISSVGGHLLALMANGKLMATGQNAHGQLGLGDTSDRLVAVPLPALGNVTSVSTSFTHSLALTTTGSVFSWGADAHGELGYRAPERCEGKPCAKTPRPVALPRASAVSAGWRFSVAIGGGQVLSWGANEFGQLGDGKEAASTAPVRVTGISAPQAISAGETFTLAMAAGGPAPDFAVAPKQAALATQWAATPGAEPWSLSWRPARRPSVDWRGPVTLPATVHSYLITGVRSQQLYEVRLKRLSSEFGFRIGYGTPR